MITNLIKVFTDNYEAIYIDGVNEFEEDSINIDDVLVSLEGKTIGSFKTYYISPKVLEEEYGFEFPVNFSEFKLKHLD